MTHDHPPHSFAPNECLRCGHELREHDGLEAENARLRCAIEDFILWWDMPPFILDDERLRAEVDALRAALAETGSVSK